jgi:hypothetical protein
LNGHHRSRSSVDAAGTLCSTHSLRPGHEPGFCRKGLPARLSALSDGGRCSFQEPWQSTDSVDGRHDLCSTLRCLSQVFGHLSSGESERGRRAEPPIPGEMLASFSFWPMLRCPLNARARTNLQKCLAQKLVRFLPQIEGRGGLCSWITTGRKQRTNEKKAERSFVR